MKLALQMQVVRKVAVASSAPQALQLYRIAITACTGELSMHLKAAFCPPDECLATQCITFLPILLPYCKSWSFCSTSDSTGVKVILHIGVGGRVTPVAHECPICRSFMMHVQQHNQGYL